MWSFASGRTFASGLNSIALGNASIASGDYSTAIGSNANTNGKRGSFVYGDAGNFTFHILSTADNEFAVRATGGFRLVTAVDASGNPTAGAKLAAGSGSWSTLSDRNLKANFATVDNRDVLQRLVALPVSTWNYTA